ANGVSILIRSWSPNLYRPRTSPTKTAPLAENSQRVAFDPPIRRHLPTTVEFPQPAIAKSKAMAAIICNPSRMVRHPSQLWRVISSLSPSSARAWALLVPWPVSWIRRDDILPVRLRRKPSQDRPYLRPDGVYRALRLPCAIAPPCSSQL